MFAPVDSIEKLTIRVSPDTHGQRRAFVLHDLLHVLRLLRDDEDPEGAVRQVTSHKDKGAATTCTTCSCLSENKVNFSIIKLGKLQEIKYGHS